MTRTLSIALDRYDRHIPFFMGLVEPPEGLSMKPLEVGMVPPRRDGVDRHKRMLVDREFDIAEVSLASYILARERGEPVIAVPTAPRRLFSQNHIYVNVDSGIEGPQDLAGRRIAIWAFQVTMSVLAKGDLQQEYGVSWRDITWLTQHAEEIDWSLEGANIQRMPAGRTGADMLFAGEVDAYIDPHPPEEIYRHPKVRRLFPDTPGECHRYWSKHGFFPVMHLLALKSGLVDAYPELPREIMRMWDQAKEQAREFYVDHNFTVMPLGRYAFDASTAEFSDDVWQSGLAANQRNLEMFIDYMVDQELLKRPLPVESLFHSSVLDT